MMEPHDSKTYDPNIARVFFFMLYAVQIEYAFSFFRAMSL